MSVIEYATVPRFNVSDAVLPCAELTLREAADVLGVPESDLVELLDAEKIASRSIGNRRVVFANSLHDYERETARFQDEALNELTQQTQELGLD